MDLGTEITDIEGKSHANTVKTKEREKNKRK
jgi:hypothetical protein